MFGRFSATPANEQAESNHTARMAALGHPADLVIDRVERLLPQPVVLERNEPLGRGAKDDRVVAAPAVRVAVLHRLAGFVEQRALFDQQLLDLLVGFLSDLLAGEP